MNRLAPRLPWRQVAKEWRELSEKQRQLGAEAQARTLVWCADGLEARMEEARNVSLTLDQAAEESGYSRDHLGRLVREGEIPNAGESNAPRIRRRDLPRKPGYRAGGTSGPKPVESRSQIVRSIVESD